ncbi:unnamed protein product [Calicophoron daubneyi]|uniref:RUN domain-containing protein n=1 Tax=Calicophoron daubneyi TaxID=300641 RepID=A0AAV2TME8_CALDB
MINSPPQFKIIKAFILRAYEDHVEEINDSYSALATLCEAVEHVLCLGLCRNSTTWSFWNWMNSLPKWCESERIFIHPGLSDAVQLVRHTTSVATVRGRGRLIIRTLMQRALLDFPLKLLIDHPIYAARFYDTSHSVLNNEILVQIFCSLISEVCRLPFKLNLDNAEFLDETWEMPEFKCLEFVPCKKLGVRLEPIDGHLVVTRLDPSGVAAEDNQVELGDVFGTMHGQSLRSCPVPVRTILASHEGLPIPVGIVKARGPDGKIYSPIRSLLRRSGIEDLLPPDSNTVSGQAGANDQNRKRRKSSFFRNHPKCRLIYLGSCNVGSDGGVHMINQSILGVLQNVNHPQTSIPVHMELGELSVNVWPVNADSGRVDPSVLPLFKHSYPQISSCGRRTDNTNFLAYIVGEEVCTVAKEFKCFVFEAVDNVESKRLINGIAEGFDRTHWTL